jgi:hypothetical protein
MTTEELSIIAKEKKSKFVAARNANADFETLKAIGEEYTSAIAAWHKLKFPKKKFRRPSVGYLIRAL